MTGTDSTRETPAGGGHGRYGQTLHRSIGVLGNVMITLSGVTPASSVFIIAPVALVAAGSGSFLGSLLHPVTGNGHGGLSSVAFSSVLALTAVAVFSYNGYANAVNFSEETTGSSRRIARAILVSLVITVAAELIPLTAVIAGSPSIARLSGSAVPMQYFIEATSNKTVYTIISLGVVVAILNAVIAIVLSYGRIFFSSGRDRAWPGPVNERMTKVSPRLGSPWLPTALVGVLGAVLCLTVALDTLVNLTGASLVADYALIAIAALFARPTGATAHGPYRMPLWPLPPLLALASLIYIFTQQTSLLLRVTLITVAIGLVYWAVVILPQRGRAWNLLDAAADEES
jgi:amino acid transporter